MNYNPSMILQSPHDFVDLFQKEEESVCTGEDQKLKSLNHEHVQKINEWIKALRSKKYYQINYNLRTEDGYCCLGVGCDVIDGTAWHMCSSPIESYSYIYRNGKEEKKFMPESIYKQYGLTEYLVKFMATMNDMHRKNFEFIADFLEVIVQRYGVDVK